MWPKFDFSPFLPGVKHLSISSFFLLGGKVASYQLSLHSIGTSQVVLMSIWHGIVVATVDNGRPIVVR